MQLTSFFPEHLVLYGLAAVSAKGPSGAQLLMPARGCLWGPRWAGLFPFQRCLVGPGLTKRGAPDFSSPRAFSTLGATLEGALSQGRESQLSLLVEVGNEGQGSREG